ncbi:MAG: HipA family kinase [Marinobacter sp.]|uniref:HipA family kinase n=1 Tax=Marinobacter sp. TaxID=50741 RepID=UPI00349FF5D8
MSPTEMPIVEIVEVLRRSEHGMTRPFICRGDDGEIYFVKGFGAGRDSQIKEWVAGNLARGFSIPVAPFRIVDVPDELAKILSDQDAHDLGVGPAFGSLEQRVTELAYTQISDVPQKLRHAILAFDWWISNADRMLTENGGNPNLFWEPDTRNLIVIDHNQSFDPDFSPDDFSKFHAFKNFGSGIADDLFEREHYTSRMEHALSHWKAIVESIPREWLYRDQEMTMKLRLDLNSLLKHLQRFNNDDFWNWK